MQLTPRYGADPLIVLDGDPAAIAAPANAQRRRLVDVLAGLDDDQWQHPTRCEGWSVRDVVVHLDTTNAFWGFSLSQGLRGEPSQLLAAFDPVASPAQMVRDAAALDPHEVLARYTASSVRLAGLIDGLDADAWQVTAEAPPGHLAASAVIHHALWDSWIHERDICLPLGLPAPEEPEEVRCALRYAAALSPGFAVVQGTGRRGRLAIRATDPTVALDVAVGPDRVVVGEPGDASSDGEVDVVLEGTAVSLLEALSMRAPLECEVPADARWMLDGLAHVFDQA